MKQNRLCYISRNYYNLTSAGNKAKTDNEDTLDEMGAVNLGLHRTVRNSKIIAFSLILQEFSVPAYCFKKATLFSCNILSKSTFLSYAK